MWPTSGPLMLRTYMHGHIQQQRRVQNIETVVLISAGMYISKRFTMKGENGYQGTFNNF